MDNLKITNPKTLQKSYDFILNIIKEINEDKKNNYPNTSILNNSLLKKETYLNKYFLKVYSKTYCEPFLSKRNLYRNVSKSLLTNNEFIMFNLLYYGDGVRIKDISKILGARVKKVFEIASMLKKNRLIDLKR